MIGRRSLTTAIVFGLASAGLSTYVSILLQSRTYTILSHGFRMFGTYLVMFLAFWVAFYAFLILTAQMVTGIEAKTLGSAAIDRFKRNTLAAVPFIFFLLTPLLFLNYLTREDLRSRLVLFGVFVGLAALYIKIADLAPLLKKRPPVIERWRSRIQGLSHKKKIVALFVAAFLIYNVCTFVLVGQGVTFSGDEPNYLMTAHSLLYDRDINLANNYANNDHFHFYSFEDNPKQTVPRYGHSGKKGPDTFYSVNLPGTSMLILPWYWLSQFFPGRWLTFVLKGSVSIWAVLLGLQIFLLARDLWRRESLAFTLWLFYSFSAPILFYAVHLYPEIPIALFSIYIYRKLASAKSPSNGLLLFLGFLLGSFLWFGVKYNFIFWPLLLVSVYFLWIRHKVRARILLFLLFPVIGSVLFYYFVFNLYGTISPFVVYEGIISPERTQALRDAWLGYPLSARTDTLFDYFLDQRDGLLLYSPVYLFMFLGLVEAFRRSKRDLVVLLFLSLPFILNYAFFTHRQGFCPQARVFAPLSWIGAVFIGYFLAFNKNKIFAFLFWAAGAAGLSIAAVLLFHSSFLYQPTTHEVTQRAGDFFLFLSNMRFLWPPLLPSFIKVDNAGYLPNYVWIAAVLVFALLYVVSREKRTVPIAPRTHFRTALVLLGIAFILWVAYPRTALYPVQPLTYANQKTLGFYPFPMGKYAMAKNEGEIYLHAEQTYRIFFSSRKKLDKVKLAFGSEAGEYDVAAELFDLPLFKGRTIREKKDLIFTPAAAVPYRNLFLYEITFSLQKRSPESLKSEPYLLQIIPLN